MIHSLDVCVCVCVCVCFFFFLFFVSFVLFLLADSSRKSGRDRVRHDVFLDQVW